MTVYSLADATVRLEAVLEAAERDGVVVIRRADGRQFEVSPVDRRRSTLDVPGVGLKLEEGELASVIREIRERGS